MSANSHNAPVPDIAAIAPGDKIAFKDSLFGPVVAEVIEVFRQGNQVLGFRLKFAEEVTGRLSLDELLEGRARVVSCCAS